MPVERGSKNEPIGDILTRVYERVPTAANVKVRQVNHVLQSTMQNFKHARECKPYRNIGYICDLFVKLRKMEGIVITIHDLLAFVCTFCGHGAMNGIRLINGEVRQLGKHSMHECSKNCCGEFLDRRFLQYLGGRCECGVVLLNQLRVRPATEEENEWR